MRSYRILMINDHGKRKTQRNAYKRNATQRIPYHTAKQKKSYTGIQRVRQINASINYEINNVETTTNRWRREKRN